MRIIQLELRAFGPFTGEILNFDSRPNALQIVYGPNEAGKSSALRGLRQLLFGIPHISTDAFRHNLQQLRVAAVLEHSDERRLACIRRKGNKNTLRGEDDNEVLPPEILSEFLGGLSEEMFGQMFGIDHQQLILGGQQIVRGGGEVGQMLFAAGAGIADLRTIQRAIDKEAEELFAPTARTRTINLAISELDKARKARRDCQLPSAEWSRHDQAWRSACKRREEIEGQFSEKSSRQHRLTRLLEALPAIGARKRLLEELSQLDDVPLLRSEFPTERADAAAKLISARSAESKALDDIQATEKQIAATIVPVELLNQADELSQLHLELGSHQKAMRDRPQLVAEVRLIESDAASLLKRVRPDVELNQFQSLRLTDTEQIRIQNLGSRHAGLENRLHLARQELDRFNNQLDRFESQLQQVAEPFDVTGLRKLVRQIEKQGPLEEQLATKEAERAELREQLRVELNRIGFWSGTIPELEALVVPLAETIDEFESVFARFDTNAEQQKRRLNEGLQEGERLAAELEKQQIELNVPTETDLQSVRQQRDTGWTIVQKSWRDKLPLSAEEQAFVAERSPVADLTVAFESVQRQADDLSDRLRREAQRVQIKAAVMADQQRQSQHRQRLEQDLAELRSNREQREVDWSSLWAPLRIVPRSPREMRSWRVRQQSLMDTARNVRSLEQGITTIETRIKSHRVELLEALLALNEHPVESSLAGLLAICNALIDRNESQFKSWKSLTDDRDRFRLALPAAMHEAQLAEKETATWRAVWSDSMRQLGLDESATAEQANAALNLLSELFQKMHDADRLRQRIEDIDRDGKEFERRVEELAGRISPVLAALPAVRAAHELGQRLNAAREAKQHRDGLTKLRQTEIEKLTTAQQSISETEARLTALCQEANCENPDLLPQIEQRSARRRELEQILRSKEEDLMQRSAGMALDEFVTEAESHDGDQLKANIDALGRETAQLLQEKEDIRNTEIGEKQELERCDGGSQGAEAEELFQFQLASLGSHIEQYARLRLAGAVLRMAIDRYRQNNQDPILDRANRLFVELTVGSFQGLKVEIEEGGQAVLVGIRARDGEQVAVDQMSEGTRDQLYLALRLASLHQYLEHKEPVPFVVDDILIQFDNERAIATIKALTHLSARTQVVFFTHHEHLLQLASDHLNPNSFCVHRLGQRSAPVYNSPLEHDNVGRATTAPRG